MALLAGSTSVYMSIKCVLVITSLLEKDRPDWRCAFEKPGKTIRRFPNRFTMIKLRYSRVFGTICRHVIR